MARHRININDKNARKALKAVRTVIAFVNNEECLCSSTEWVDTKGYAMDCDVGYFYEGLTKLSELLVHRLRGALPRYPQSCKTYNEETNLEERRCMRN